jgi:hypothetical protein
VVGGRGLVHGKRVARASELLERALGHLQNGADVSVGNRSCVDPAVEGDDGRARAPSPLLFSSLMLYSLFFSSLRRLRRRVPGLEAPPAL